MAANRRKKQKAKQRRHSSEGLTPESANVDSSSGIPEGTRVVEQDISEKTKAKKSTPNPESKTEPQKGKVKRKRRGGGGSPSPVTSSGAIDWSQVGLKFPGRQTKTKGLPAMTSSQLMHPGLGIFSVCMCLVGIVFTGRWSLLLLAILAVVLIIDPRVRSRKELLIKCVIGSALAVACLPLVSRLPDSIPNINESLLGSAVVLMFATSLWLIGGSARQASSLQDRPFPQVGLYSVGMACQALCCIVLLLSAVLITLIVNQSL